MTDNKKPLLTNLNTFHLSKESLEQKIKRITKGLFNQIKSGCYRKGLCYNKYCKKSPHFLYKTKTFPSDKDIVIEAIQLSKHDLSEYYLCLDFRPSELSVQWKSSLMTSLDDWVDAFNYSKDSPKPEPITKLLSIPGTNLEEFLDPSKLIEAISKTDVDIFEEVINFNTSMSLALDLIEKQVNTKVKKTKLDTRKESSDMNQIFIDNIKTTIVDLPTLDKSQRKVSLSNDSAYSLSTTYTSEHTVVSYLLNSYFRFIVFLMANPSIYYNDSYKQDLSLLFENFSFLASLVDKDFMSKHFLLYIAYPKHFAEVVSNFQNYLTILLCALTRTKFTSTKEIRHLVGFLRSFEIFYMANQWLGGQEQLIHYGELKGFTHTVVGKGLIPKEEFHNDSVNNYLSIKIQCENYFKYYFKPSHSTLSQIHESLMLSKSDREEDFDKEAEFFSFIKYFFLYDASNKNDIIKIYNLKEQTTEMTSSLGSINSILSGLGGIYLVFDVRRDNLIEDTLNIIIKSNLNFKKPLKVKFKGEQGVDEGGVKKEFFMLLIRQLFDVDYGMFTYNDVRIIVYL